MARADGRPGPLPAYLNRRQRAFRSRRWFTDGPGRLECERAGGRGAAWTEERATKERATREGGASKASGGERSGLCVAGLQTCEKAAEAAEVTAFWQELGLPGLVDVHTHFMPPNVQAKVWAVLEQAWPIAYRQPEVGRVALLRAFGVCRFGALAYPHKPGMAAWLNAWQAEFAARTPEALHSATFFPEAGADGYVADAITAGARLFKAHLQVGGYDPRDELLGPVWGLLAEARVPVVVHCGSGPTAGAFTGPGPISEVLARHPRLITIIAHLGSPEYSEFLELAHLYPGVHLDTTMAFTDVLE